MRVATPVVPALTTKAVSGVWIAPGERKGIDGA
jgi:hypothetical protein